MSAKIMEHRITGKKQRNPFMRACPAKARSAYCSEPSYKSILIFTPVRDVNNPLNVFKYVNAVNCIKSGHNVKYETNIRSDRKIDS